MKEITIGDKKYLLILNDKVFRGLNSIKGVDIFDDISKIDDPEVITYLGYEGIKAGAEYNGEKVDITPDQFGVLLSTVARLEIQNAFFKQAKDIADFVSENMPKKT